MSTLFSRLPAPAAAVVLFFASIHASIAAPQAAPPPPTVSSTLDVCQDSTTGNWRYSGLVSVLPSDPQASVAVDYWVQNKTSRDGYATVYQAAKPAGHASTLRSGDVQLVPFSFDAPPLTLGTLRGAARVAIAGQADQPKSVRLYAQDSEVAGSTCGCGPTGCVRTQGYWGNKPGVVWPGDWNRAMNFYSSGLTWQQVYDTPPRGNAYIILADQFMSAVLNRNAGASAPQGVQDVMAAARDWFSSGTTLQTCVANGSCQQQKVWAGILDVYNNGFYPGGPSHCKDGDGQTTRDGTGS
jgi:hypothetical protein